MKGNCGLIIIMNYYNVYKLLFNIYYCNIKMLKCFDLFVYFN